MNEWLRSKEISDFNSLKELVLVEEFKACVNRDLKLHLEELKLDKLQEVAIAADEYTLSHRTYGNPYSKWKKQSNQSDSNKDSNNKGNLSRDSSPKKGKGQGFPDRGSPS